MNETRRRSVSVASMPLRATALIALIVAAAVLAGCGQKGDLYLPSADKAASAPAR